MTRSFPIKDKDIDVCLWRTIYEEHVVIFLWLLADRFLGDQRASYNHKLSFYLSVGELGPRASIEDVILEGAGLSITSSIFAQGHTLPSTEVGQLLRHFLTM